MRRVTVFVHVFFKSPIVTFVARVNAVCCELLDRRAINGLTRLSVQAH